MRKLTVRINDHRGIHAHSAIDLCKITEKYNSKISISNGEKTVNADNIIDILSLNTRFQSDIIITITGLDEEQAFNAIS